MKKSIMIYLRFIIFVFTFFFCSCSLYGQNTIVANDLPSLMQSIDKLHPPHHRKRKVYKSRYERRQKYLTSEISDLFFNSDTLYVMVIPDPSGMYANAGEECLYCDNNFLRIDHDVDYSVTNSEWDAFLRAEMDAILQGKYKIMTPDDTNLWEKGYFLNYFIKLIRTTGNKYSYQMDIYYIYHFNNDIRIYKKK
ncbi:MAG: hypothetical protein IKZ61_11515 [Prevotella sp.]|nr:hypothetical protein [Prevotella sp.]